MENFKRILIAGGAGFVGSNIALKLKAELGRSEIFALDNLHRRGSELNISRLQNGGVRFMHGDIRNKEDLNDVGSIDLIIECSAEPSVLAGVDGSPEYAINTNLLGTINCLELARKNKAAVIFLSTSRVYPMQQLNQLSFTETETRFSLDKKQRTPGASANGIAEHFPIDGPRSIYGATKLCSELLLQEYIASYGIHGIINRCGVITGPWQMGKVDQGVIVLWIARHIFKNKPLSYIGFGGAGKQVRDFMHIDDLFTAVKIQLENFEKFSGQVFNIGGGLDNSLSLLEMTKLCQKITGNKIPIESVKADRPNDVRIFITDSAKFKKMTGWKCKKDARETFTDIYQWITKNSAALKQII